MQMGYDACIGGYLDVIIMWHMVDSIDGNYLFSITTASGLITITPFGGVIFSVVLHDFIRQNYHKNQSDRYPFFLIMVNYPTFLINYRIFNFQMYYQYLFFLLEYPKNASIYYYFIGNFWNRSSYRNDFSEF